MEGVRLRGSLPTTCFLLVDGHWMHFARGLTLYEWNNPITVQPCSDAQGG